MNKTSHIRDVQDWYDQWSDIKISKDTIQKLQRGPMKDFQVNFLLRHARTDEFIETMRTNNYVNSGKMDDSIKKELSDTMFADKLKILQELNEEINTRHLQCEKKNEILKKKNNKRIQDKFSSSLKKGNLYKHLKQRIEETNTIIKDLESLAPYTTTSTTTTTKDYSCNVDKTLSSNDEEVEDEKSNDFIQQKKDRESLETLSNEAHLAFQSVVLRHFLDLTNSPNTSMAAQYGHNLSPHHHHHHHNISATTAQHFNSLVSQVVVKSSSVVNFVHEQVMSHLQTCIEHKKVLDLENQNPSVSQNMADKINDIAVLWSRVHVEANQKNKIRERQLKETQNTLDMKQKQAIANAHGCRISDVLTIMRREELNARIVRCRQHTNSNHRPIQNIFKNISSDSFKSHLIPSNEHLNMLFSHEHEIQPWILAISNSEHLEDILIVLQKTWPVAKRNLVDMISFAKEDNEFLPNILQTSEFLKISLPRTRRCIENIVNPPQSMDSHQFTTTTISSSSSPFRVEPSQRLVDDMSLMSSNATTTMLTNTSSYSATEWVDDPITANNNKSQDDLTELAEMLSSVNARRNNSTLNSKMEEYQKLISDLTQTTW